MKRYHKIKKLRSMAAYRMNISLPRFMHQLIISLIIGGVVFRLVKHFAV